MTDKLVDLVRKVETVMDNLCGLTPCGECNGSGRLTRLGGDWGRLEDTTVTCWACNGLGSVKEESRG
jgi:DnaJ-class molecular chaperone